jgi:excisionase family DNA binding protein
MNDMPSRDIAHSVALSVEEACKRSSLGRTTFYKLMKSGLITARKCGNRTIILWDELEQALKSLPLAGSAS